MVFDNHFHLIELRKPRELAPELLKAGYSGEATACFKGEWEAQEELFRTLDGAGSFRAAFGIHPMSACETILEDLRKLGEVLERNAGASVGECGLDRRFPGYEPGGAQEKVLREQILMAKALGRRLTLHCVGDNRRLLRLLDEAKFPGDLVVYFHRFSGDGEIVRAARRYNARFGNPKHPECVPKAALCLETDADQSFNREGEPPEELARRLVMTLEANRKRYLGE